MGKKAGGGSALGRQLQKTQTDRKRGKRVVQEGYLHTAELQDGYDWGRMNLQSVTEDASYIDFLNTAEAARKDFDSEKWNVQLLDGQTRQVYIDTTRDQAAKGELTEEEKILPIPRRPDWTGLSPEELKIKENDSFLEWRRYLAGLQEEKDTIITPYEKNIEFWRQLWRVIERSDLVVQILDSRNPLLFRSLDLEKYVNEVSPLKKNLILLNKADFLTPQQREEWVSYFGETASSSTRFAFFSAIEEDDEELEEQVPEAREGDSVETVEAMVDKFPDPTDIMTSNQLLKIFRSYKRHTTENITVGFIGYPNVGKSSTINKLLQSKKVRVSETPGKTKHFQTLVLTEDVTLCDCPGLVMPSVVASKADMVLNGILPVDQLRDHVPAVKLLLDNIPTHTLEAKYGLVLPPTPEVLSPEQVLTAYATMRGYMATGGRPDQSRASRYLLKDYVAGKLLHCICPPGREQATFHSHALELPTRVWNSQEDKEKEARRLQQERRSKQQDIDIKFFDKMSIGAHVAGSKKITGRLSDKNKKKEKIKRLYPELDPKHA